MTPAAQLLAAAPAVAAEPFLSLPEQAALFDVLVACANARGGWVRTWMLWDGFAGEEKRRTWARLKTRPDAETIFASEGLEVDRYDARLIDPFDVLHSKPVPPRKRNFYRGT
jgi:hypothetical protein